MGRKILGYCLIFGGLATILYTGFNCYQVFTGKKEPIGAFSKGTTILDLQMPQNLPGSVKGQQTSSEMSPPDVNPFGGLNENIVKTINLSAHFFLATFIINAAAKIAQIGVQMIRPIKVNLNTISEKSKQSSD